MVVDFYPEELKSHPKFKRLSPQQRRSILGMIRSYDRYGEFSAVRFLEKLGIVRILKNFKCCELCTPEDWVLLKK